MIYWGVVSCGHDASLAVVRGNQILFAAHAERYSRVKNDGMLNQQIVDEALAFGVPNQIVWYEKPWLRATRHLWAGQPLPELRIRSHLRSLGINTPVDTVGHHESHAAGGFYTSNFQDAAILVCDAIGEWDTISTWYGSGDRLQKISSTKYPHSLGLLYSAFTHRLGLKPNEEEYIMMGMAALGTPRFVNRIVDDFLGNSNPLTIELKRNVHRGIMDWAPELNSPQDHYDIAASIQLITENWLVESCKALRAQLPSSNLVLSGGVALNCVANTRIAQESGYENIWIMPNPGDAGSSLGAIAAYTSRHLDWQTPYLGTNIGGALDIDLVVDRLVDGDVLGIARGRAEWGPRSLGNRALVADPRGNGVKDKVNAIKKRQMFRPFAPVILEQYADQYFEMPVSSAPYMQFTAKCRYPELFPAICHFDNTSRVQTVSRQQNSQFYELLSRFHDKTGCPMLLNTSLNIKGEPLVNSWRDALRFTERHGISVY